MGKKTMEWVGCDDESIQIPWTKVCVWDGANTFWAYLQKIIIENERRTIHWKVVAPEGFEYGEPLFWMKISEPIK